MRTDRRLIGLQDVVDQDYNDRKQNDDAALSRRIESFLFVIIVSNWPEIASMFQRA